ncbi:FixH family protein [Roseicella frigidaeris]|uniref:Nitrogen fixation protein fixH n=1 Tax=Roseicella frigidaeris TaxID=2230885 RepID=A0A327MCX6_9PROT|nr:FixH family protein [Roseicella frigidaeris]RAI59893.1 nitrogen fixation protein fixH [Roseicella frigidaeris]
MSAHLASPRRSGWIPWVFVGGLLLVVAVNGGLIYFAVSTFTGVTVGKSYDKGRAYNHVLEEAARQDALGWQPVVRLAGEWLQVAVTGPDGRPVAGRLEGVMRRPIEGTEIEIALEPVAPGRWRAPVELRPGQWEARLRLTAPDGRHRDIRERVLAP